MRFDTESPRKKVNQDIYVDWLPGDYEQKRMPGL